MNLFSKKEIQTLLWRHGIKPSKGLGQNFLINKKVVEKILKAADLEPSDLALEIGPGIGNLTQELAKTAKKVVAIEKDKKMVKILKETLKDYKDYKDIKIVNEDILKLKIKELFKNLKLKIKNYRLIANLPYYITSPVIRKFLESELHPETMVLMLQKEVAQRICAKPPKMSLLAVSVQFYAKPEIISYVKKENFWPKPKVDSAIIKITPLQTYRHPVSAKEFFMVGKAGFSQPRKQLANNLAKGLKIDKDKISEILLKSGVNPSRRAETLSINDWIKISILIPPV